MLVGAAEAISLSPLVASVLVVATAPPESVGFSRTVAVAGAAWSVATTAAPWDVRTSAGAKKMNSMLVSSAKPVLKATASSVAAASTQRPTPRWHPLP